MPDAGSIEGRRGSALDERRSPCCDAAQRSVGSIQTVNHTMPRPARVVRIAVAR